MTKEIKRVLNHLLETSQRMVMRELPLVSQAIKKINKWIWGIDYRKAVKMREDERTDYDQKKISELKKEIEKVK